MVVHCALEAAGHGGHLPRGRPVTGRGGVARAKLAVRGDGEEGELGDLQEGGEGEGEVKSVNGKSSKSKDEKEKESKKPSEDTKEAIAWWKDFYAKHEGKIILDAEESAMGHLVASSARFALKRLGVEFDATEVMFHVD
jgi:hypothetical protein